MVGTTTTLSLGAMCFQLYQWRRLVCERRTHLSQTESEGKLTPTPPYQRGGEFHSLPHSKIKRGADISLTIATSLMEESLKITAQPIVNRPQNWKTKRSLMHLSQQQAHHSQTHHISTNYATTHPSPATCT